jgi:hypothetical protein
MSVKIISRAGFAKHHCDTGASHTSDPPEVASNPSRRILVEAHQLVAASRQRICRQLLADGFVPRSLRTRSLRTQTTIDALVGGPSESWEVG